MSAKWNFPSKTEGGANGVGEGGVETFKGSPYPSLAREICQNSLDARAGGDPVRVEFSLFSLPVSELPGEKELRDALERCQKLCEENKNERTQKFCQGAIKVLKPGGSVSVLRISDYKTTGLLGSKQELNSPWQNLVKASGGSSKGGSDGGSYGIGKSAPFACSDLRTVFYATLDSDGLQASQGVARLASFRQKGRVGKKGDITTGIGYYGEKYDPIRECISLDPSFRRDRPGADVYILGFAAKKTWVRDIVVAVLENFLLSIYHGALEVRVAEVELTRESLPRIVEEYKESAKGAYSYYQALTSPAAQIIPYELGDLGRVEFHLLIQNGLCRRVYMGRSNGMKVYDQKHFPQAIQFAGVCVLRDERINAFFREMENPQHDKWEPERHSQKTRAEERRKELVRFLKDTVAAIGRQTPLEEVDAAGVGDYLPDMPSAGGNIAGDTGLAREPAAPEISRPVRKAQIVVDFSAPSPEPLPETGEEPPDPDGAQRPAAERDRFAIRVSSLRLMRIRPDIGLYRLSIVPEKAAAKAALELHLSGEQPGSRWSDFTIRGAIDLNAACQLPVERNRITLYDIRARERVLIEFELDYAEYSSMEVSLYGYQAE